MKASLSSSSVHTTQVGSSSDMLVSSMDSESPSDALYMDDETFARMLAAQDTPTQPSFPVNGDASDSGADAPMLSLPLPPTNGRTSMSPDEEFALRLAAEEGRLAREGEDLASAEPPDLPAYTKPASPRTEKLEVPELPRLQSAGAELTWVDKTLESPIQPTRPASMDATTFRSSVGLLSPSKDVRPSTASEDLEQRSLSANQYLDADLLRGVSIGFIAPSITAELLPMQGSMPNVVSLPYGRCPPLHLQAPSWRHLLKLMARLSGTRFEPTVEALAVARTSQMRLRTVVQFIRLHPTSDDWRTVLWFTTDHPVPASMPNSRKYTSNDVDVLPWSYTLSSLPALLRDSSDTVLSKCYTIPGTPRVPYPALPITFPDMVLYLQAALDESRHAAGDRDGGLRKLSKMMDTCYPSVSELGEDDRGRINKLFKKFQGGKKDKGRKGKGGGNEDTYELVTPFLLLLLLHLQLRIIRPVLVLLLMTSTTSHPIVPLTADEEDQVVLARINNDERGLRRVIKKLHQYTALAYPAIVPHVPSADRDPNAPPPTLEDAREAFLVELASFRLMLRKSVMICEAEARQVEEYKKEKEQVGREHSTLRDRIEQLKIELEHEQMLRRRKMEYDVVADRVNALPTREELQLNIQALENDIATIRAEHEAENRTILAQKAALDDIVENLGVLWTIGREQEGVSADETPQETGTPAPEASGEGSTEAEQMEVEEGEEVKDNDIEMGEVAEGRGERWKQ
ncbi:hypothetical protein MKEN_00081900 [Mycena kentingensis (nom. inval.)]|nr:hypothetical protein MKEN_00081900 [Mycena kentingensis (nom. inval.)]